MGKRVDEGRQWFNAIVKVQRIVSFTGMSYILLHNWGSSIHISVHGGREESS